MQLSNVLVILTVAACLFLLFQKKVRYSPEWRATVTPLASIIGSGFLVSAPLLILTTGRWAAVVMTVIVVFAYALGSNIRFNIHHLEPMLKQKNTNDIWALRFEEISRPVLGLAYIISVAFYLKLLSAFALRGIGISNLMMENTLTTALLLVIGLTGKYRGLAMLESYETYAVNIKLSIIAAIIVGHAVFNVSQYSQGGWYLTLYPHDGLWLSVRKLLGILIIVQGFETSRFLGQSYSKLTRIQTMRYAQWISGIIYVLFISTTMIAFNDVHAIGETTVIDVCKMVAPILPILLIVAAVMSQFSAAVADTVGSGGLLAESLRHRVSVNNGYLAISIMAIALTWTTNIYEIIVIASKAFAIYYALQLLISIILLVKDKDIARRRAYINLFSALFVVMLLVILFGIPAE